MYCIKKLIKLIETLQFRYTKISLTFILLYEKFTFNNCLFKKIRVFIPWTKYPVTKKYEQKMKWKNLRHLTKYQGRHYIMDIVNNS